VCKKLNEWYESAVTKGLAAVLASTLLYACGGSGGGVQIGSGQSADPVVVDYPIFYVKRPFSYNDAGDVQQADFREVLSVEFGADLYMRERASAAAPEVNLTGQITEGFGDIRDVSVSSDGEKVLFSMRTPIDPGADEDEQPTWSVWEYHTITGNIRRIMEDDITAEEGHDIGAQYLPDDRIIFSSTRQNQAVAKLTDQGKPQFAALDEMQNEEAFVLHVMNSDGTGLTQVSFNQSHDLYPSVLDNGRILFSRWDAVGGQDSISLYTARPDGADLQLFYGAESHATGNFDTSSGANGRVQFLRARELQDGRILALIAPNTGTYSGGDLVLIDGENFVNESQTLASSAGAAGPGQQQAALPFVSTVPGLSRGGRFGVAWPMWDGSSRLLLTWTPCLLRLGDPAADLEICSDKNYSDPQALEAEPSYGIWVYDFGADTLNPVLLSEPGVIMTDVILAQPRARPLALLDLADSGTADPDLLNEGAGILHIRSVYDFDGQSSYNNQEFDIQQLANPVQTSSAERPARFVRIYKAVGIPDEDVLDFDNSAFGLTRALGMREIIGYAPVEPDGSVMVRVPADIPLAIDVLDKDGRRIFPRHLNWLQVRPGEVRECNGCHDPSAEGVSHGRRDAFETINAGAPVPGYIFPNTNIGTSADFGETMAQTRARYSCFTDCEALRLTIDLIYEDVWTDVNVREPDAAFAISYMDIAGSELPERDRCLPWTVDCRVIINYEAHIQPLWEVSRDSIDPESGGSCIDCHALNSGGQIIEPDDRGQLELTRNSSAANANHFTSYRELLAGDTRQAIIDGTVQQELRFQGSYDDEGNPIDEPVFINSRLSLSGANASAGFFDLFTNPESSHHGWLSEAELRLIAEWLDIGAQYFNDPFNEDVPLN